MDYFNTSLNMAATPSEIEEFLDGPLVKWLSTCVKKPETLKIYESFFDGSPINEVLLQIDPEPTSPVPTTNNLQGLHITSARIEIFHTIIKNIQTIYEQELGQVLLSLPDCVAIGRAPASSHSLEQLRMLILLLLGCAVQGPTKERFITKIKELDVDAQHDIVECIKQITVNQELVLTSDWTDQAPEKLFSHIKDLTNQRSKLLQQYVGDLSQESGVNVVSKSGQEGVELNHFAVELADWKAKVRKIKQELEEQIEIAAEYKEELEHATNLVNKLKAENNELIMEARKAKLYRDEADAMKEQCERAERLDLEIQRYRERLAEAEFYKVRVEELREDNRVLIETREMLEEQLMKARQRADQVLELEGELLAAKQQINDVSLERDSARAKIQELIDENLLLEQESKSARHENSLLNKAAAESDLETSNSGDNSLSEQLTSHTQARVHKLERDNTKLQSIIDSMKDGTFLETTKRILELETDKKGLMLKCEELQAKYDKCQVKFNDMEAASKLAHQELKNLQTSMESVKAINERQNADLHSERGRNRDLEDLIDNLSKEKGRVQTVCDSIRSRADMLEKNLNQVCAELQYVQGEADKGRQAQTMVFKLDDKNSSLEKENYNLQKEVTKLKETVEEKDVILDRNTEEKQMYEKEIQRLNLETTSLVLQIEKLQEFEQKATELVSQASVHAETIATLQKDLVNEKVSNEKFKNSLDKVGLSLDILDNDVNIIVEKMLENSEFSKCFDSLLEGKQIFTSCKNCCLEGDSLVKAEEVAKSISEKWSAQCDKLYVDIATLQAVNGGLQNDVATLKVDNSTLKSQVHSLQSQQTTLQLANSQLVAEKEELSKQQLQHKTEQEHILSDQATLRALHEQLSIQYEDLKKEQETLRKANRDLRSEVRVLKDKNDSLELKLSNSEQEKDSLKTESMHLGNLRSEHSKLKDDFRNLFTASERMKIEYKNTLDELKVLRMESRNLKLSQTEIRGELCSRSDTLTGLEVENARLHEKCQMLYDLNLSMGVDRKHLMDHVSQLLTQYHTLLTHSLEDKEQFHREEKEYTEKLNNLSRQKEKLEEKIMEHYKNLENATKKKGLGSNFVRRLRQTGSDIISRVPHRNRRSWHEDASRLTQSQFTLLSHNSGESDNRDSDNSTEELPSSTHRTINNVQPFRRNTVGTGSLHGHKPRDEIALRRSHRDLSMHRSSIAGDQVFNKEPGSALSLGSVGSRRTVYLSEDDTGPVPVTASTPQTNNQNSSNNPPLLVYNRISTVIGADASQAQIRRPSTPQRNSPPQPAATQEPNNHMVSGEKREKNSKETAVWYEYGCV